MVYGDEMMGTVALLGTEHLERVLTEQGRAFDITPTVTINEHRLPPEVRALQNVVRQTVHFPSHQISVYRVRDAYVAYEGLVFNDQLQLYSVSQTGHSEEEVAEAAAAIKLAAASQNIPRIKGTIVLCKKRGANNYGHFMIEMLPKAIFLKKAFDLAGAKFLVSDEPEPMRSIMEQAFALIEIGPGSLLRVGRDPVFVEDLIVVDGLSEHSSFMSPVIMDCLDELQARIPAGHNQKLYITRKNNLYRRARNESAVVEKLIALGYKIIDPVRMSLAEQISCFKGASVVAGVTGAGMTNTCFCLPGTKVISLMPVSMPDNFFWFISGLRQLRYFEVRLPEVGGRPESFPSWCDDVLVDLLELMILDETGPKQRLDDELMVSWKIQKELEQRFIGPTFETSVFE